MRKFFLVLFLASIACTEPIREQGQNIGSLPPIKPPVAAPTPWAMIVSAEDGLRLRDAPDGQGSQELTIMPDGSVMTVIKCQDFNGQIWVYGSYGEITGWAAKRFLKGECDG